MHTPERDQQPRLVPAWRGIVGWLLFLIALALAATTPWPHNGQALAALLIGCAGIALVARQVAP